MMTTQPSLPTDSRSKALLRIFGRKPVLQLHELQRVLGMSGRTVFRHLDPLDYLSSYSHAGRYYTLRRIPTFGADGLWFQGEVRFSAHGTLRATVVVLVKRSPAGRTHDELQAVLGLRIHDTLRSLVAHGELARERFEALYIYVHPDPKVAEAQMDRRRQEHARAAVPVAPAQGPLDLARVVDVLVAFIQEPGADPATLARRLQARGLAVSEEQVEGVFVTYGLKKTVRLRFRRSRR